MLLKAALFAVVIVIVRTVTTLLAVAIAATALLVAALIIVVTRAVASLSWCISLQICTETFGTEAAFVVITFCIIVLVRFTVRARIVDSRTRRASCGSEILVIAV